MWVFEGEHDALARANVAIEADKAGTEFAIAAASRQPAVGGLAATQWYRIPYGWEGTRVDSGAKGRMARLQLARDIRDLARPEDWWVPSLQPADRRVSSPRRRHAGALPAE